MKPIGKYILIILTVRRDLFILDNLADEHYKLNFDWFCEDIQKWKKTIRDNSLKLFIHEIPKNIKTLLVMIAKKQNGIYEKDNFKKFEKINERLTRQIRQRENIYKKFLKID